MTALLAPAVASATDTHHQTLQGQLVRHTQSLFDPVDSEDLGPDLLPYLDAEQILPGLAAAGADLTVLVDDVPGIIGAFARSTS